jgi:hypothetical protein
MQVQVLSSPERFKCQFSLDGLHFANYMRFGVCPGTPLPPQPPPTPRALMPQCPSTSLPAPLQPGGSLARGPFLASRRALIPLKYPTDIGFNACLVRILACLPPFWPSGPSVLLVYAWFISEVARAYSIFTAGVSHSSDVAEGRSLTTTLVSHGQAHIFRA